MKKLLTLLVIFAIGALGISCKCHKHSTIRVVHEFTDTGEEKAIDIEIPISKQALLKYNVTVFRGEKANCGGTVVKSTKDETLILTAAHCILNPLKLPMPYGYVDFDEDDKYRVEVVDYSRNQDLALLKVTDPIEPKETVALAIAPPEAGDEIWLVGYGALIDDIITDGIVSKPDVMSKHTKRTHCMIVDASMHYGNSGGGVYNEDDGLVGVVIQFGPQHPAKGTWSYAVHLDEIRKFLEPHL